MESFRGKLFEKTDVRDIESMSRLRKNIVTFHLVLGIIVFIIFLVTGRYMRVDFPDKDLIPQDLRLRGIFASFGGVGFHLIGGIGQNRER